MSIRNKAWYPILYMFAASVFFVAILVGFGAFTNGKVQANKQIAFELAALKVLPIDLPDRINPAQVHEKFIELIADSTDETAGALRYIQDGALAVYVLPLEGQGFWAPVKGVIGIAPDKRTITGIAFYAQEETPGLGGEIVKEKFTDQFAGKILGEGQVPLEMKASGADVDAYSVNAVTGATQTSNRVARFINTQLASWRDRMDEVIRKENTDAGQ